MIPTTVNTPREHKPFVPPNVQMKEFTLRAVLLGLVMCVILGAANAYLGLRAGQTIAATEPPVVRAAIAKADDLPSLVTVVMALPGFPTGPVNAQNIERVAEVMLEFGVLGKQYSAAVEDGTLIRSMVS